MYSQYTEPLERDAIREAEGPVIGVPDGKRALITRLAKGLLTPIPPRAAEELTRLAEAERWFFEPEKQLRWYAGTEPDEFLPEDDDELDDIPSLFSSASVEAALMGLTGPEYGISPLEFGQQIEVLAAHYAVYGNLAVQAFPAANYDGVMEVPDGIFDEKLNEVIDSVFSYGKYMMDRRAVADSIRTRFRERAEVYARLLANGFSTGVEGTERERARRDAFFVATRLLDHVESTAAEEPPTGARYTVADIRAMIIMDYASAELSGATGRREVEDLLLCDAWLLDRLITGGGVSRNGKQALMEAFASVGRKAVNRFSGQPDRPADVREVGKRSIYDILPGGPGKLRSRPEEPENPMSDLFFTTYVKLSLAMEYIGRPILDEG